MMNCNLQNQLHIQGQKGSIQINNGMGELGFHRNVSVDPNGYIKANGFISKHNLVCHPNQCAFFKTKTDVVSTDNLIFNEKQTLLKKGTIEYPSLAIQNDTTTGLYSSKSGGISIISKGNNKFDVSENNLSIVAGSVLVPAINFGLKASDKSTGIYRIKQGEIGFSSKGERVMKVSQNNGLEVTSAIKRMTSNSNVSWEDGYLGDSTGITIVPNEFINKKIQKVVPKGFTLNSVCVYTQTEQQIPCIIKTQNKEILNVSDFKTNETIQFEDIQGDGFTFVTIQIELDEIEWARISMIRT
jgi:hypothetical protein